MRQIEFDRVTRIRQIGLAPGVSGQAQISWPAGDIDGEYPLQRPMRITALVLCGHILPVPETDPPSTEVLTSPGAAPSRASTA